MRNPFGKHKPSPVVEVPVSKLPKGADAATRKNKNPSRVPKKK